MSEREITGHQLTSLRNEGIISEFEIAIIEGDLLLAKNVVTEERRVIGKSADVINENTSNKRILKG